ncbi:hypothetical protein ACL00T_09460 [Curtobacterium flaccumfaciens]
MKAAPEDQVILLDVQRLDNDVTRIAHRITSLQKGDQLTELSKQAAALRSELVAATGEVEDAERDLARLESDTAVAQARVERDTTMLQNVANAKDAAGLQSAARLAAAAHRRPRDRRTRDHGEPRRTPRPGR